MVLKVTLTVDSQIYSVWTKSNPIKTNISSIVCTCNKTCISCVCSKNDDCGGLSACVGDEFASKNC